MLRYLQVRYRTHAEKMYFWSRNGFCCCFVGFGVGFFSQRLAVNLLAVSKIVNLKKSFTIHKTVPNKTWKILRFFECPSLPTSCTPTSQLYCSFSPLGLRWTSVREPSLLSIKNKILTTVDAAVKIFGIVYVGSEHIHQIRLLFDFDHFYTRDSGFFT